MKFNIKKLLNDLLLQKFFYETFFQSEFSFEYDLF